MDVNLTVKVPGLDVLVKYAASGIGAIAGPMLAPWRAKREAQARLISAQAQADCVRIIADAQTAAQHSFGDSGSIQGVLETSSEGIAQRIEYQERKRQANISSVLREAAQELGDKEVTQHEPDHDWAARFFACAQDVSSADMRRIWAQILAGEVEKPGATSPRTLATLRNLTASEAKAFLRIARFRIGNFAFPERKPILDGHTLPMMVEVGLIRSRHDDSMEVHVGHGTEVIHREPRCILVVEGKPFTDTHLWGYEFTRPGKEIAQCIEPVPDMPFLERIADSLQRSGFTLKIATSVFCNARGEWDYNPDHLRAIKSTHP